MSDIDALLEAERRGLLPPDKTSALAEARKRGLIPAAASPSRSGATAQLESKVPDYRKVFASPLAGGEQSGLSRFARGTQDFVDRGVQLSMAAGEKLGLLEPGLADIATQQMNAEQAAYEQRRQQDAIDAGKPDAGIDFARIGGGVAPIAPLAALGPTGVSVLARAGAGALQGAAAGALTYDATNSVLGTAKNALLSGIFGAIAGPVAGFVGDKIGAGVNYLAGRVRGALAGSAGAASPAQIIQQVPQIGALPPAQQADLIAEAAQQIRQTGQLNADALSRKANLIANLGDTGRVTKSMVTRNPQDFALERNLSKLTGPDPELNRIAGELTDTYAANDAALRGKLGSFSQGLPQGTQEALGQNALQSIDDLAKASQKDVGKLYDVVRAARGDELASDARKLYIVLDDLSDSPAADQVTTAAKRRLTRLGMLDSAGQLTNKTLTVKQAEGLRQFINQQPNSFGKSQLIRAIDEDVIGGLGDDAFGQARAAAAKRFELLDNPATQRALNAFGELQQGKTAQNFIKSQIIDGAEQDVTTLLKTLETQPGAVNSLRAGVLQHLEARAVNPNSGQFSGANFNKALQQIGIGKLAKIFGTDRANELLSLSRAAIDATYQPAYSAVNSSNSASMLLSFIRRGRQALGVNVPVLNEAAEQAAARSAARGQLRDTFAAQSTPRVDSEAGRAIGAAIGAAGGPSAPSAVEELRKRAGK